MKNAEKLLGVRVQLSESSISDDQFKEVLKMWKAGEEALAIETLIDIVFESDVPIKIETANFLCQLADSLGMQKSRYIFIKELIK